jgi:hypothetical protein
MSGRIRALFHTKVDCTRIRNPDQLRKVDKPYDASRCSSCARA